MIFTQITRKITQNKQFSFGFFLTFLFYCRKKRLIAMLVNEQILTEYFLKWCDLNFGNKLPLSEFKFTNYYKYVARFECNVDSNNDNYNLHIPLL